MSDNSIRYSLSWPRKAIAFLFTSFLTLLNLYLLAGVCIILINLPPDAEPSDIVIIVLLPIIVTLFFSPFIGVLSNLEPDILVSDDGLRVKFFWFWWIFVPWEDIEDMRVSLFGLSRSRLVVARKLTFVHRIIGASYGTFFKPTVLISSHLERQSELVATIKKHIAV